VLFDSGDTLIQPIGGRWNPRFDFEGVVQRHFPTVTDDAFPAAIAAGQRLLDASSTTVARDDYHRRMLEQLDHRLGTPEVALQFQQHVLKDVFLLSTPAAHVVDMLPHGGHQLHRGLNIATQHFNPDDDLYSVFAQSRRIVDRMYPDSE
jgi:hypothetical protein